MTPKRPTTDRLYWSDSGWKSGSPSLTSPYPRPTTVSSYDVLDALVNGRRPPTCAEPAAGGHRRSLRGRAGGQPLRGVRPTSTSPAPACRCGTWWRTRRPTSTSTPGVRTAAASAPSRASEVSACSSYNNYKYGLAKLNTYASTSPQPLPARYAGARVDYLLGELDTDPNDSSLDTTCAAKWQGPTRFARGSNYFRYLGTVLGDGVYDRQGLAVVPGRRALGARHVHVSGGRAHALPVTRRCPDR